MATLQSTGLGSGLDVRSLVAQLVAAERAPKQNQITKQQTEVATKISAMGSLKGALGGFQTTLANLKTVAAFNVRSATSSDDKVFTATATSAAPEGVYDVKVEKLAKAHQLSSDPFAGGATSVVGTGLLTLSVGAKSFTVNVTSSDSTLEKIRDAINKAPDNTGVRAAIVQATDGAHLVLTSTKTGAANALKITAADGDGGLSKLTYSAPGDVANYTQLKAAQDAVIEIAGFERKSDSNTVKDVIDGVTLTLLKEQEETDEPVTLDIKQNTDAALTRINNFVSQYNTLAKTVGSLQSYEPSTQKAGPLLGDSLLRSIDSELKRGLTSTVAGATGDYQSLASLGITTSKDGTLTVDENKVRAALQSNFDAVGVVFGSENGVAARLDKLIAARLTATSEVNVRTKALNDRSSALTKEQAALETRMTTIQERYMKQFTALDSLLVNMQKTSSYLTQQLANLPKIGE
jgi:flagellar hook-associated protein 2